MMSTVPVLDQGPGGDPLVPGSGVQICFTAQV